MSLGGIDTLFDFSFLDPIAQKAQDLTTLIGVGACQDSTDTTHGGNNGTCRPIVMNYTTNAISITVVMRNFQLYFDVLVKLGVKAFKGLKLSDVAQPTCLLPWFQGLTVDTLHMAASKIEFPVVKPNWLIGMHPGVASTSFSNRNLTSISKSFVT